MPSKMCHLCGKALPDDYKARRPMPTGRNPDGTESYRPVRLCPRCIRRYDWMRLKSRLTDLIVLVFIAAVVGAFVYFYRFHR